MSSDGRPETWFGFARRLRLSGGSGGGWHTVPPSLRRKLTIHPSRVAGGSCELINRSTGSKPADVTSLYILRSRCQSPNQPVVWSFSPAYPWHMTSRASMIYLHECRPSGNISISMAYDHRILNNIPSACHNSLLSPDAGCVCVR